MPSYDPCLFHPLDRTESASTACDDEDEECQEAVSILNSMKSSVIEEKMLFHGNKKARSSEDLYVIIPSATSTTSLTDTLSVSTEPSRSPRRVTPTSAVYASSKKRPRFGFDADTTSSSSSGGANRGHVVIRDSSLTDRKKASTHATNVMMNWMITHQERPYPTSTEKKQLAASTGLTTQQVNHWMSNNRKRKLVKLVRTSQQKFEHQNSIQKLRYSAWFLLISLHQTTFQRDSRKHVVSPIVASLRNAFSQRLNQVNQSNAVKDAKDSSVEWKQLSDREEGEIVECFLQTDCAPSGDVVAPSKQHKVFTGSNPPFYPPDLTLDEILWMERFRVKRKWTPAVSEREFHLIDKYYYGDHWWNDSYHANEHKRAKKREDRGAFIVEKCKGRVIP
eukprot:gene34715-42818_t